MSQGCYIGSKPAPASLPGGLRRVGISERQVVEAAGGMQLRHGWQLVGQTHVRQGRPLLPLPVGNLLLQRALCLGPEVTAHVCINPR